MKTATLAVLTLALIFTAPFCRADTASDNASGLPPLPPIAAPDLAQTQPPVKVVSSVPEAQLQTELEKYKTKLKQVIGSRWYAKIYTQDILLSVGTIKVHYTAHANGAITVGEITGVKPSTMLLQTSAVDAIHASSPFHPFSAALRQSVGDSFTDVMIFTIDSKDRGSIK